MTLNILHFNHNLYEFCLYIFLKTIFFQGMQKFFTYKHRHHHFICHFDIYIYALTCQQSQYLTFKTSKNRDAPIL